MDNKKSVIIVKQYTLAMFLSQLASCIALIMLMALLVQVWNSGKYGNGPISAIIFAILMMCLSSSLISI